MIPPGPAPSVLIGGGASGGGGVSRQLVVDAVDGVSLGDRRQLLLLQDSCRVTQ